MQKSVLLLLTLRLQLDYSTITYLNSKKCRRIQNLHASLALAHTECSGGVVDYREVDEKESQEPVLQVALNPRNGIETTTGAPAKQSPSRRLHTAGGRDREYSLHCWPADLLRAMGLWHIDRPVECRRQCCNCDVTYGEAISFKTELNLQPLKGEIDRM